MAVRNVPQRSGRTRGHESAPTTQAARLVIEEMHRPSAQRGKRQSAREATRSGMARARQLNVKFKPSQMGAEGRIPLQSPSTRRANLRNAKRKPEARRGKARQKSLRA